MKTMQLPLKDGQAIIGKGGRTEIVAGEIKPAHSEPIAWTVQGNWYRRRDARPMTSWKGRVLTIDAFYRARRMGVIGRY